ncbi:iron-containing alcohol dehydrogenase [Microvirga terrae]|uniref:Iron-containing alcohol dehydrogenase n=1 Tax=Microvirga terrae TaxID=2740529 RepID=A0ABY5RSC0_9HYPH|nr:MULTISPECIES: iron-containing alcohol dehydrogenase [Microvirga]MBQ0822576.1 iron-containing alcohol dehydrogenase [Microvirga sp. HBU67558]UVF20148.1 iron-containing alcohol dehydrogenase [Microvirga terrae]
MSPFTFSTAPSLIVGSGSITRLGEITAQRLGPRVFLVTDAGLVKAGLIAPVLQVLEEAGIVVDIFDAVVADPPEDVVLAAAARAKEFEARAVIGFGGGSSIDVAKLVALLAASDENLPEIYGVGLAKGPRLPLLAVPTTAGTGSEVTPISIVTTGAHEKKGVVSALLIPDIALLDPDLTVNLPPAVTAATGIDAMVHAIEAYTSTSPNNNPLSRALAKEALVLLGRNIERAVHHGQDIEARSAMLLGSMLAGQAFANSPVAAVHALAYPIGGHFGVPHGLSNALVLPHVLRFNAAACEAAYAELGPHAFPDLEGRATGSTFVEALAALCARVGLPPRLRDVGIPREAVPMMAEDAMKQTRLLVNNPRSLALEDARAIYEAAW